MGVLTAVAGGLLAVWAAATAALVVAMVRHDRRDTLLHPGSRCACGRYYRCDGPNVIDRDGSEHTRHRCQPAREAIA